MIEGLSDEVEFTVVTRNRDLGDPAPYTDIAADTWYSSGAAKVLYVSSDINVLRECRRGTYDVLYLNSLFDPWFTLVPLISARRSRVVIAPRGECSKDAMKLKKLKKATYLWACMNSNIYKNVVWQASTDIEAADICEALGRTARRVIIAPDMISVDQVSQMHEQRRQGEPLRICFLGRIARIKNLRGALEIISQVRERVHFDIYGPIEDERYWRECAPLVKDNAKYCGTVPHERVIETLAKYDLMFMPSHSENFGNVIAESLRAGTPVMISDRTPWRDLERAGAGWDLPLSEPSTFVRIIEQLARNEIRIERARVAECVREKFDKSVVRTTNLGLFL